MADNEEKAKSEGQPAKSEGQPASPPAPAPVPAPAQKTPPAAQPSPKPPPAVQPRAPLTKPPPKPPAPARRNFLKIMTVVGGILGITPFIPYGAFFTGGSGAGSLERQRIQKSDAVFANVNNMVPDSAEIFVYPRTNDPKLDAEPFRRYQLIRLAGAHGGDSDEVSSFRAYSMICVHLWCLWDYVPGREVVVDDQNIVGNLECPCHGSNYNVLNGKAYIGPAADQTPPNDALASLPLELDAAGDIWVTPPNTSFNQNGIVGIGREV